MRRLLVALLAGSLLLAGCGDDSPTDTAAPGGNPFAEKAQFRAPTPRLDAAAAQAETDGDDESARILRRIAEVPTGIWLTPERYPTGAVGPQVTSVVQDAGGRSVPVFVVYGIPDRDCTGQLSAGGLDAASYPAWVEEIATAAGDDSVVVLEPDALPAVLECDGDDQRLELIGGAVDALVAAGVTTYVDAGHSDWRTPEEMADLLRQVGVEQARGFSTNVSNYQPQPAETAYAEQLSTLLDDAHYVIDTGRNGDPSGTQRPVDQWCNPEGRALGTEPGFVDDGTPLDALLWVKPPAESDGTCGGGPAAGEVWLDRALALGRASGW